MNGYRVISSRRMFAPNASQERGINHGAIKPQPLTENRKPCRSAHKCPDNACDEKSMCKKFGWCFFKETGAHK
jgi:hypothetical protein